MTTPATSRTRPEPGPADGARAAPPTRGNAASRALGRLALRVAGWRVAGELPALRRFVVIVAPHTSNWDFPLSVAAMFALGLRISWLGKHSLFRGPAAGVLRWLGGMPVDRSASRGVVEQAVDAFRDADALVLGLSPEGTRRRVERWRTGFHAIARGAGVPIVPVWLDYERREVGIGGPLAPTADTEGDVRRLRAHYRASMARRPAMYAE